MAKYQHFEELPVWQEAARLYNMVLDLLEEPGVPLAPGFRHQLDRAALAISSSVAEGFERAHAADLQSCIADARGAAGDVRSMMAVLKDRPKLSRQATALQQIRELADSCARQLAGWSGSIERMQSEGRRPSPEKPPAAREPDQRPKDTLYRGGGAAGTGRAGGAAAAAAGRAPGAGERS